MAEGKERYGEYKENAFDPCGGDWVPYGEGIKQLTPIDDYGHLIIDYSIHDAIAAGFHKIIFSFAYGKVNSEHGWHEAFDCVYIILVDACEGIGQRGGGQKSVDMGSML